MTGPVRGVMLEDRLCPAVARLLRAGIRAEAHNGWRAPADVQSLVDVVSSVAREQAMSGAGRVSPVFDAPSAASPDIAAGLDVAGHAVGAEEAAGLLHLTSRQVRRLAASGHLEAKRAPGGAWLISRRSVDAYGR